MTDPRNAPRHLLHCLGAAGPARVRVSEGTGAPKSKFSLSFVPVLVTAVLVFSAAPALATRGDVFSKPFGSGPCTVTPLEPCEGKFDEPSGVAVNNATGDVYVIDADNNRVEYFNGGGGYQGEFDASGEDLLVEGSAAPTGQFSFPSAYAEVSGVAVDNNPSSPSFGDVYVADVGHGVIDKFSATGHYEGQVTGTCEKEKESPPCPGSKFIPFVAVFGLKGIAVDSNGELWVAQQGNEGIANFSSAVANEFLSSRRPAISRMIPGFAVDSEDNLYVAGEYEVSKLNSSGDRLIDEENINPTIGRFEMAGIAVDPSTGDAYIGDVSSVGNSGNSVGVFDRTGVPTFDPWNAGTLIERFGSEQLTVGGVAGIALDSGSGPSAGNRYVADLGADEVFTYVPEPFAGPALGSESVANVSSDSATLDVQINPSGADTSYYFQYGTVSCTASPSSCTDVPLPPGADIGSEFGVQSVSQQVQGLRPSTVYHYRVIAHNSFGGAGGSTVEGPDQTFTTQGPGGPLTLPDGRAWEMVSPVQKLGAQAELTQGSLTQASEDGGAISYTISAPFVASPAGNVKLAQALSRRAGGGGWSTEDIATPYTKPTLVGETRGEYRLFSADLSYALVEPFGDNPLTPEGKEGSIYVRDDITGAYTLLTETESQWYEEMDQKQVEETVRRESGFETCDASTDPANGSPVVGSGEDGCIVYFVSGLKSQTPTLYVAAGDSAGAWTVSFIATLSAGDWPDWEPETPAYPGTQTAEASPDGRYLAFMSERSLTGYDNRDASSGEPDEEVYRFHYEPGAPADGSLVCASCDPTGARPAGWLLQRGLSDVAEGGGPWRGRWVAATILGRTESAIGEGLYEPRYMLDNGRLFFDSHDALVPQDINGVNDVYEYESGGTGSCPAASSGCVALLSGGTGPDESAFADASVSGNDVFIITADKLASQDVGNEYDMYDAHVCSAEAPCPASAVQSPPCTNEASCKAPQALQPGVFGPSGSATFSGAGNSPPPPPATPTKVTKKTLKCRKGHTKNKKGRCIKKHRAKKSADTNRRVK
jgi:hypothetical protein